MIKPLTPEEITSIWDAACKSIPMGLGSRDYVTHAVQEFARAIQARTIQEGQDRWYTGEPPKDQIFLAYHPDLVHDDFIPEGVVEAYWGEYYDWNTGEGRTCFIGAVWDGCNDLWEARPIEIEQWKPIIGPRRK